MSEGIALQITQNFETICCYKCQILFAVPAQSRRRWIDSGESFYCPNGHSQHYTESTVQKLEKQLAQQKKRTEWARQEAEENKRKAAAQKGQVTKLKNRAKAGVCPCCKRHFKQLEAHMQNKHPDFNEGGEK